MGMTEENLEELEMFPALEAENQKMLANASGEGMKNATVLSGLVVVGLVVLTLVMTNM